MSLDAGALASQIVQKMTSVLTGYGKDALGYAKTEGEKIAQAIVHIGELLASGQIDAEEAKMKLDIQKQASTAVLLAVEGIAIIAVEQAINGALDVIKGTVNSAVGFALI